MDAFVERWQAQKADRAEQRESRADHHQARDEDYNPDGKVGDRSYRHSMTSPRIRNFASATVETKPRRPMTRAASKYTVRPLPIPKVTSSSMAIM